MISPAARILGCDRGTIMDMAKRIPAVQVALEEENELAVDMSEIALFQAVAAGKVDAIKFHLKCKGRGRGYIERADVVLSGGLTLGEIIEASMAPSAGEQGKA